jgi:hypothetical protein
MNQIILGLSSLRNKYLDIPVTPIIATASRK